jgi:hypothetical protein
MSAPKYRTLVPDIEFWMRMIPCQAACPVKTDAGKYVQLIAEGQFKESYLVARSPNPFASVCGRVCAAPCEDACRRGRIDAPITIRALKRFVTEKYGVESMEPDTQDELREGIRDAGNKRRGHLPMMRQFSALTGSPAMALLLQAAVFAVGHVSLGPALMISVSLLAVWLGALTLWQKSLVPAMIVHAGISLFGGLAFSP